MRPPRARDLGYTYGELARRGKGQAPGEARAVFLRIWVRTGESWQVAADKLAPLPASVAPPSVVARP